MGNRRARRAEKAEAESVSAKLPLAQPDRTGGKAKTLYDIAAERQAELLGGQPFEKNESATKNEPQPVTRMLRPDGTIADFDNGEGDDELLGPLAQALFNAVTLTMLHFTLEVLVHQQYRTEMGWTDIMWKTMMAFPFLLVLIYALHPRASTAWAQGLFLVGSVAAGCYLVRTSTSAPYYAVMKQAPPLGTLWVWTVIEMKLRVAVVSVAVVGFYFWWGGFSIFN